MEPVTTITTAILAAIAAGAAGGTTEASKKAIIDAYNGLKTVLKRTVCAHSDLVEAVAQLEQKPDSAGRKTTLQEEIIAAKVNQRPEVIQAAQTLLDQLKAQPGGEQHIQTAIGNCNAIADRGSKASVVIKGGQG
jgi:hypothetical protein